MSAMSRALFIDSVRNKYDEVLAVTPNDEAAGRGSVPENDVLIRTSEELPHEFFKWATRDRRANVVDVRQNYGDGEAEWSYRLTYDG